MNLLVKILLFLLVTTLAHAEYWVCYSEKDSIITKIFEGDCKSFGLCSGFNNTELEKNCFEATKEQFDKSKERFVIFENDDVVDMKQSDKDAILVKEALDAQIEKNKKDSLVSSIKNKTGMTDEEISFIIGDN